MIMTLPGSVKGATENLDAVIGVLHHAVDLAKGDVGAGEALHKKMHGGHSVLASGGVSLQREGAAEAAPHTHHQHHGHDHHRHHHHHHHHHTNNNAEDVTPPVATRARTSPYPMIPFADAVALVLAHTPMLPPEKRKVGQSIIGAVLAEDVISKEAVPGYRASIVDGYAVISKRRSWTCLNIKHLSLKHFSNTNTASDGPGSYPVISASTAGSDTLPTLQPGQIVRVTTGAPVPPGANAVVMVEYTTVVKASEDGTVEEVVAISTAVKDGENIREVGSDVRVGETVLEKGQVVTTVGGEIGVLASVGVSEVRCFDVKLCELGN